MLMWLQNNIATPGLVAIKKLGLLFVFLVLAVGAGIWAYLLQQVAFPAAGSSAEQISATVYVEKLPAQVSLQSTFTPGNAINNVSFTVNVIGPTKAPDPWLLVVQCEAPSGKPWPWAIPLYSESGTADVPDPPQQVGSVILDRGPTNRHHHFNFTCFTGLTGQDQTSATVIQDRDLNLSLPVLQQNPDAQPALAGAPLYIEQVAGNDRQAIEVQGLPGVPCPSPTPGPSSASSSAGSSSLSSDTPSPSPTATSSPSLAATTSSSPVATSPPSPSVTTSATPSPSAAACYTQISRGATSVKYSLPAPTTVVTSEILNNVNLSDERIDSMYPQGIITNNQVTWNGGAGLSPSLSATNLHSAERLNKDAFLAGLLYGIAAALAIPYLVEFYKVWHDERERLLKDKLKQGHELSETTAHYP